MNINSDLISLIYSLLCIHALWLLCRDWRKFWDERVTAKDKDLVMRLAIFFFVPIGVLLHEIGHSVATWQVGGTVAEFQWRFYWGYIVPVGDFSWVENWWIGFSGNLVSILLGLLPVPLIPYVRKRIVGELLYTFACVQLIYSLVAYPIMSLGLHQGDWFQLYKLTVPPYIWLMAVVHVGLVIGLWKLHHSQKALEWRLASNPTNRRFWHQLTSKTLNFPCDLQAHLDLAYFLLRNNETHAAKQVSHKIFKLASHDERVKVLEILLDCSSRNYRSAIKSARKLVGVDLLLEDKMRLYRVLCYASFDIFKFEEALFYANKGLTIDSNDYRLRWQRALLYQKLGQYRNAILDIDVALELATDEDIYQELQECREQLLSSRANEHS